MNDFFAQLSQYNDLMWSGSLETLYMVGMSLFFAFAGGIPLGVLTTITRQDHILPNKYFNFILDGKKGAFYLNDYEIGNFKLQESPIKRIGFIVNENVKVNVDYIHLVEEDKLKI